MSTHCLKLFRFAESTNFVHAVADLPGCVISRWRCWLVVTLLAGCAEAGRAQFWLPNYITNNAGFEAVALPDGGSVNYGPGPQLVDGWTYSGDAGIARDSTDKTNGIVTEIGYYGGGNYAFLRASATPGTLQRLVYLPLRGNYRLQYYSPVAANSAWQLHHDITVTDPQGHVAVRAQRDVGASDPNQTLYFSVTNPGLHTLSFGNLTNYPGTTNNVVLLDSMSIGITNFGALTNGAFDAATLSPGQFRYYGAPDPQPDASWAYGGNSGIATDSSNKVNFATGYPGVYSGTNYAFLRTGSGTPGFIEQAVLVPATGRWLMSFDYAGRQAGAGYGGNASFRASVLDYSGNTLVATQLVATSGQLFTHQALGFQATTTGPFRLRFDNLQNTSGTDNAVFIDGVRIDHYDFFMVPNSSLDILNTTGSRWYFYSAPQPAPAHMSRMDDLLISETPWGTSGFLYDAPYYVQDRIFQGEYLRVYSESVPNNTIISIPAAFTPLGQQFSFNILVGESPFVESINIIDPSPTAAASVRWLVTLSQGIDNVTAGNFMLFNPNGITNPAITSVTGSGSNWIVTASTGTGYGLLGLNWVATADEQPNVPVRFSGQVYDFSPLPIITEDPASVTNLVGTPETLEGGAIVRGGGTPTYQWFEGSSQFPDSAVAVSGATNTELTMPATTNDYTRTFFLRAYNGPGYWSDSLTATVRIVFPPAITSQPADQAVGLGQTAMLSVGVSGTAPFVYTWYSGALGDTSNPVGTNSSCSTPPLGADGTFWVQVLNDAGPNYAVTSRLASVHITTTITRQPSGRTVCPGNATTFVVGFSAPSNITTTIQWQRGVPGGSFTNIPGANTARCNIPAVSAADDGSHFRAVLSSTGTNLITSEAPLSVVTISAPTIAYDFSSAVPTNTAIYGSALASGQLVLNPQSPNQSGAWLTADLAPGHAVSGFIAHFAASISGPLPLSTPLADGFSFNWAPDLPNGTYVAGEQGEGSGLRVCFQTYDDGSGYAPCIDVKWGTNVIGHFHTTVAVLALAGNAADVMIRLNTDGTLDMTYRCLSIFTRLPIPGYQPQFNSRFGLGSRTDAYDEAVSIQNLSLQLFVDPTNGVPGFTSMAPQGQSGLAINGAGTPNAQYPLFTSQDLVNWQFRTDVTLDSNGLFQFVEPNISSAAQQFYRLKAAPNLPSGLVSWWRGDGNYLDSYGGRNGSNSVTGPTFTAGVRTPAFNFGGTNALSINSASLPAPWTVCVWVNRTAADGSKRTLFSGASSSLNLDQDGAGHPGMTLPIASIVFQNGNVPPGQWTHLAFVGGPRAVTYLINGVAQESALGTSSLPLSVMGAGKDGISNGLKGAIDEVMIFDRALTPAEVSQVINATRAP